jgi:WD40 repeat protein
VIPQQKATEEHLEQLAVQYNALTFELGIPQNISGDETIRLWDTATGELQQTLKGHLFSVNSVAFSPDGRIVASGSGDRTIRLWDTATGELQQTLEGHFLKASSAFDSYFLSNNWIVERADRETLNILWLPPDYRPSTISVYKEIIVMGHSSGGIFFFRLEHRNHIL